MSVAGRAKLEVLVFLECVLQVYRMCSHTFIECVLLCRWKSKARGACFSRLCPPQRVFSYEFKECVLIRLSNAFLYIQRMCSICVLIRL